jgi:calcineurin-like phosphoesterase family protein
VALVFVSRSFLFRGAASFLVLISGGVMGGCKNGSQKPSANPSPAGSVKSLSVPAGHDPVLVGAGDIASCEDLSGAEATAKLLDSIPGVVFTAGDNAYASGTAEEFRNCYQPTWGRHKDRTRPSVGNHEFHSDSAAPYFDYFGPNAGDPTLGYYSYELGTWHIVVLNSQCGEVGGCQQGSREEKWLRSDLEAHPAGCVLAYWHIPLFSSGAKHGNDPAMKAFWIDLYNSGATVVINGHDHDYERFAPQDPNGKLDPTRGIREFVAGTGGRNHRPFAEPLVTTQARNADTFGVLKVTLHPGAYEWEFIPEAGKTFHDAGAGSCH